MRNRISGSDSGYEEAHMLCGAGGVGESAEGWDGGGGGGVEANLGGRGEGAG